MVSSGTRLFSIVFGTSLGAALSPSCSLSFLLFSLRSRLSLFLWILSALKSVWRLALLRTHDDGNSRFSTALAEPRGILPAVDIAAKLASLLELCDKDATRVKSRDQFYA